MSDAFSAEPLYKGAVVVFSSVVGSESSNKLPSLPMQLSDVVLEVIRHLRFFFKKIDYTPAAKVVGE